MSGAGKSTILNLIPRFYDCNSGDILIDNKSIYDGYISRLSFRYQFNNDLSIRLVSEYNNFNDTFLFQPLLKWNPNPSTIFYIGGIQNSINNFDLEPEDFDPFRVNRSQFFLKFQYLIGI